METVPLCWCRCSESVLSACRTRLSTLNTGSPFHLSQEVTLDHALAKCSFPLQTLGYFLFGTVIQHLDPPCCVAGCSSVCVQFSSVQSLSRVQLFATPWTAACQASLSITNSQILRIMSIESGMPSNHLILRRPLLLLPSIFPSIRVFSNESVLPIRWPRYRSFSFSISPSNEHPGLISFRMDWLDLLAVQGTLKSLFQHHSSKASIFWCSAFFIVQLSHPYMTTGITIALTRRTFVGKGMSPLF